MGSFEAIPHFRYNESVRRAALLRMVSCEAVTKYSSSGVSQGWWQREIKIWSICELEGILNPVRKFSTFLKTSMMSVS